MVKNIFFGQRGPWPIWPRGKYATASLFSKNHLYPPMISTTFIQFQTSTSFPKLGGIDGCLLVEPLTFGSVISKNSLKYHLYSYKFCSISWNTTTFTDIHSWMNMNKLLLNPSKIEFLLIGTKQQHLKFSDLTNSSLSNDFIPVSSSAYNLGFIFDSDISFSDQINSLSKSCHFHIRDIRPIHHLLPLSAATALAKFTCLTYKTVTNQQPTYLYNSLSFLSHSVSTRSSDSLVLSIPYSICHLAKGLSLSLVHDFGIHYLLIPEIWILYQSFIPGSKHACSKLHSFPRLFPISLDCLPGFQFLLLSFYALLNDT